MSRRGAILQDYGGVMPVQPQDAQIAAANFYQRDKEFAAQQKQIKQQNSDKEAAKLIGDIKLDPIGDNTIDVMTEKQLQALKNNLMDMHMKGASNTDLQLYAQRELPKISNGHTVAKNKYEQIKSGLIELGKDYKSADLSKARELAVRPMIEDVVQFDDKGNAIGYKDASLIPERNYLENLMNDDNIEQWYKPSGEFEKHISGLPTPPISGGFAIRDKSGKKTIRKFTGTGSMFDELVKDEDGDVTGMSPKTERVSLGNDENGKPIMIDTLPKELQDVALGNPEASLDFKAKFLRHLKEIGVDRKKLDSRALNTYRDSYLWDLINKTNLKGSAFNPVKEDLQPLPPRISVRVGSGKGDDEKGIRDVYNELQTKQSEGEKNFGTDYKGIPLNELSPTAQGIVIEYANKLTNDDLTQSDIFIRKGDKGLFEIVKSPSGQVIAPMDFTDINIKAQAGVPEKREVVEQGKKKMTKGKTFNVIDPNTGKVILSNVDQSAADKAKAKGYKIQ